MAVLTVIVTASIRYLGPKALVLAAIPLAAVLLQNVRLRATLIVFGALVAFQSSSGLSAGKVGYIAGLAVCVAFALAGQHPRADRTPLRNLGLGALSIVGVLLLGFTTALFNANAPTDAIRDSISYVLLALAPILAIDIASTGPKFCHRILLAAGGYGVLGFFLEWSSRRHYFAASGIGLASLPLVAAAFSYLCALGFTQQKPIRWFAGAGLVLVMLIATGTRTAIILLLIPVGIALIPLSTRSLRTRLIPFAAIAAISVGIGLQAGLISSQAIDRLLGLNGNQGAQASDTARGAARADAQSIINESPLLGHGLGTRFQFEIPGAAINTYHDNISTDTFLTTPAKFGWLGAGVLSVTIVLMLLLPVYRTPRSSAALALAGLLPFLIVYSFIASPLDDKGLPIGITLLLALVAAETPSRINVRLPRHHTGKPQRPRAHVRSIGAVALPSRPDPER